MCSGSSQQALRDRHVQHMSHKPTNAFYIQIKVDQSENRKKNKIDDLNKKKLKAPEGKITCDYYYRGFHELICE
jgi:hypothetical protein